MVLHSRLHVTPLDPPRILLIPMLSTIIIEAAIGERTTSSTYAGAGYCNDASGSSAGLVSPLLVSRRLLELLVRVVPLAAYYSQLVLLMMLQVLGQ